MSAGPLCLGALQAFAVPCDLVDIGANLGKCSEQDLAAQLVRAAAAKVNHVILTGCSVKGSRDARRICEQWTGGEAWEKIMKCVGAAARHEIEGTSLDRLPQLNFTAGVHPHDAKSCDSNTMAVLRELAAAPGCVSIGECGLDYDRMFSPREVQLEWCRKQVDLAVELGMPLFLHERDRDSNKGRPLGSSVDLRRILSESKVDPKKVCIHCFTGNGEDLRQYVSAGYFIGLTGFAGMKKRGAHIRQLLEQGALPLQQLMIETDCPFMLPDKEYLPDKLGIAGRKNEPCSMPAVCRAIAECLKAPLHTLGCIWLNRENATSMDFSPVPLLDVLPHHRVLDITGSSCKDLALALHERLLTKEDGARSSSGKVWAAQPWQVPQGLLFANAARPEDLEPLMATVPEKLRGPVVFTVSPPQSFPQIYMASSRVLPCVVQFDRVLCRVSSSHDSEKLQAWHMHPLQLKILRRGLRFLAPGGRLLYMTSSENAMENEVVAAALTSQPNIRLVQVAWPLHAGWSSLDAMQAWPVLNPNKLGLAFNCWEEVPRQMRGGKILQTMFPPGQTQAEVTSQLSRCLRAKRLDEALFVALFDKVADEAFASDSEGPDSATLDGFKRGSNVVVRATGDPAIVVGPGQKAFKGLIKIRYPDRTTYHVELGDIEDASHRLSQLLRLKLGISGLLLLAFRRVLQRIILQRPRLLLLSLLVSLLGWRLHLRRRQTPGPMVTSRVSASASRLVKRCAKIPEAVLSFAEFYGLELPHDDLPACSGVGQVEFPYRSLGYRTADKQNLYLVSPSVFDVRVPEQLRHSMCGAPFLQRCISSEEVKRWGCSLRPTAAAAEFLSQCCLRQRLVIEPRQLHSLLENGQIKLNLHHSELLDGGVILVQENDEGLLRGIPGVFQAGFVHLS
ncbi:unnamed protein product [Durusdinium trenchii]|uniref:Uncharacterized protein n=1 Tax=Durusdinium trenchii TaxID=1381693 RepID=A0ABP0LCG5_9DINO